MEGIDLIRVVCPYCAQRLRAKAGRAGKQIRCPNKACGKGIALPQATDAGEGAVQPAAPGQPWLWLVGGGSVCALLVVFAVILAGGSREQAEPPAQPVAQAKKAVAAVAPQRPTQALSKLELDPKKPGADLGPQGQLPPSPPVSPSPPLPQPRRPSPESEDGPPAVQKAAPSAPTQPDPLKGLEKAGPGSRGEAQAEKQFVMLPIEALGKAERLEKLKTIRLTGRASFAHAKKVNDIILLWCWDPSIVIRLEEDVSEGPLQAFMVLLESAKQKSGRSEESIVVAGMKKEIKKLFLDRKTAKQYEEEVQALARRGDYKPFFYTIWMIEDADAYTLFNNRVRLRAPREQAVEMRNLCFALSVSNLLPLKRHSFEIARAADAQVKDVNCSQFKVRDLSGTDLDFYFDKQTGLLAKIAHWGPPRRAGAGPEKVRWEHYFTDYRETDGLKQWHRLQIQHNGKDFAVIDVSAVQYFDHIVPDLQRDGPGSLSPEKMAAQILAQARETIRKGNAGLGMVRLRIILTEYPRAPAAAEAAKLLKELQTQKE